jgi:hypothetical protein
MRDDETDSPQMMCACGMPMVETRAGVFVCLLIVWTAQYRAAEGYIT